MREIWKDIKEYEGLYLVSNFGRVKSLKFNKHKILKLNLCGSGYLFVNLWKEKRQSPLMIHQLEAVAFLNHKTDGYKLVIDHIDDIKTNNNLSNLRLVTQRENQSKNKKSIGATWHKRDEVWQSQIRINGKSVYLGSFKNKNEAMNAYRNKLDTL